MQHSQPDDLTPRLERVAGPPDRVNRLRYRRDERSDALATQLGPHVDAHLVTYRELLDTLDGWHTRWVEETTLNPVGTDRIAACWQMAGRCIGLARALVDLAALGYCAELAPLVRSLHEANRLLIAFAEPEGSNALRRWLAGKQVRAGEIREAIEQAEIARAQLVTDVELAPTVELSRRMHGRLSQADHHDRAWVQDAVIADERRMATGPHPDAARRAAYVGWAGTLVEETVSDVGVTLGALLQGEGFYMAHVKPLLQALEAVRKEFPLTRLTP